MDHRGVTIWLTGLSGAGKSTVAEILLKRLSAADCKLELLDGDVVRTHLTKGLGFTKEDRDINVRRIGWVASRLTHHGVIVIAAVISPYRSIRAEVREMVGDFMEVWMKTPLEVCEERDVKGLYEKARAGEIKGFTGIDDPYEEPENPDVICDTPNQTPEESAQTILDALVARGYLPQPV